MNRNFLSDALRTALGKRCPACARALLAVAAALVFSVFAFNARYAMMDEYADFRYAQIHTVTVVVFTAIFAVSVAVQMRAARRLPLSMLLLLCGITGAVLLAKISLLDYVSDDYDIFLSNWIYSYTSMGLRQGLGTYIQSDYTPPYLYLLLLISRLPDYPWLYLIKAASILCEILLGYAVMRLAALRLRGDAAPLLLFHVAQILPTVVFNGAYWGQCDVFYTSLCLLGLWLALREHPVRSMLCFGVALSFKLQAVFFFPALLPLWLRRKVKLRHLLMIPVGYMAMMLPALWGGKSLHHVLTVYLQQAGAYSFMTLNAPNLYQMLPSAIDKDVLFSMFGSMAMCLAFAALAAACLAVCLKRETLSQESTVLFTLLVLSLVPYCLPKMHERYTFGADVLSLVAVAYNPRRVILPLLFGLASYISYTAGLPGDVVTDMRLATLAQTTGIVLTAAALWRSLNAPREARCATEVKA